MSNNEWVRLTPGSQDSDDVMLYHFDVNGYVELRRGFQDQGELRVDIYSGTVILTDDELVRLATQLPEVRALVEAARNTHDMLLASSWRRTDQAESLLLALAPFEDINAP